MCDISCQVFLNAMDDGSWHAMHQSNDILLENAVSLEYDWVRPKQGVIFSNNKNKIVRWTCTRCDIIIIIITS